LALRLTGPWFLRWYTWIRLDATPQCGTLIASSDCYGLDSFHHQHNADSYTICTWKLCFSPESDMPLKPTVSYRGAPQYIRTSCRVRVPRAHLRIENTCQNPHDNQGEYCHNPEQNLDRSPGCLRIGFSWRIALPVILLVRHRLRHGESRLTGMRRTTHSRCVAIHSGVSKDRTSPGLI